MGRPRPKPLSRFPQEMQGRWGNTLGLTCLPVPKGVAGVWTWVCWFAF